MPVELAVVILTYNEADHVAACITSVGWADRIVVFDSFSQDNTPALAQAAGAEVIQHAFEDYARQREAALQAVDADWILFVDADERSSPEQAAEIRDLIRHGEHNGYWIPRHNYIFGKLTRHSGWYPDYQLRLLRRANAHYDMERQVHELVNLEGEPGYLKTPFVHYNYTSFAQFRAKQRRYVQYDARMLQQQGIHPKPHKFITQPLRQFIWRFITLQGYRDGWHGLRLSLLMAWYEFQKYVHLRRLSSADR
ncbi:glycosyltransferase family 2 protein [Aggregatilinea lenta]|uniref:glycosyltransferase family 2 protein n=1 Tax=Aggregatilinea lenta TaxID=913108 RepID=UPI000E5A7C94|nr:glycosyltransferase family 2 protein [Aggregatilinea lenta]